MPLKNKNTALKILLVDDRTGAMSIPKNIIESLGHEVTVVRSGELALSECDRAEYHVAFIDYSMPDMDGVETGKRLREKNLSIVLFILSEHERVEYIKQALGAGFNDYLLKDSISEATLRISLLKAQKIMEDAKREVEIRTQYQRSLSPHVKIVASSKSMQEVITLASRAASADCAVLLTGESGTGKEVIARHIHYASRRASGPFVAINCAQLPDNLVESELFGHEKGSFTGAINRKVGRFELANKGTILLDEICELSLPLQAKLLRVLQEKTIDRVGGSRPIPVDFRVIAATNRDIEVQVRDELFRPDLYYRLKVLRIIIPPLRERNSDVPPLAAYFTEMYSQRERSSNLRIGTSAMAVLQRYSWPGNVRELENAIYHAVVMCDGVEIMPEHLPANVRDCSELGEAGTTPKDGEVSLVYPNGFNATSANFEKVTEYLMVCLRLVNNNPQTSSWKLKDVDEALGANGRFKAYIRENPEAFILVVKENIGLLRPILPILLNNRKVKEGLSSAGVL